MRIYPEKLSQHLAKKLSPVYCISGDDYFLIEEASSLIQTKAFTHGFRDKTTFAVKKGFAWADFLSTSGNLSLFEKKKIIELKLENVKLDPLGSSIICNYLNCPRLNNILLILAPKLNSGWQKIGWLKEAEKKAIFLQIWPLDDRAFLNWLTKQFEKKGFKINKEGLNLFAEKVHHNLYAAKQEIEKLALLYRSGTLSTDQILTVVSNSARYTIFDFIDYVLSGNLKKTVGALETLQILEIEPILILWLLARELRALINLARAKQEGTLEKSIQKQHLLSRRIPTIKEALARHSEKDFITMLQKASEIDLLLKGVKSGDVWQELSRLAINLSSSNSSSFF